MENNNRAASDIEKEERTPKQKMSLGKSDEALRSTDCIRAGYPGFKRVMEYYSADPAFRTKMDENPDEAVRELGFENLDGAVCLEGILAVLEGKAGMFRKNPYVDDFVKWNETVSAYVIRCFSPENFHNRRFFRYLMQSLNRCRMESLPLRMHENIRYFPVAFELGSGCRCRCPFCAFAAEEWTANFEYTPKNAALWKSILEFLSQQIGPVIGESPLYFATEPFDNPDYEKYLADVKAVTGRIPQTTTALADSDPERTRNFMAGIGEEKNRQSERIRFSVRTLAQFRKIVSEFSPDELKYTELLLNNPESVNVYSASGRAVPNEEKKTDTYSICCVSGFLINMVNKCITFIEPEIPTKEFSKGYRILERKFFRDIREFKSIITEMTKRYVICDLPLEEMVIRNPYVKIRNTAGGIELIGRGAGYRMSPNDYVSEALKIFAGGSSFGDVVKETGLPKEWERPFYESMNELFIRGYLRMKY